MGLALSIIVIFNVIFLFFIIWRELNYLYIMGERIEEIREEYEQMEESLQELEEHLENNK